MTIYWGMFLPGLLLLFYPADRLLSSVVQLRSFDCFQSLENSARHRPWWWVPILWIDPLRGLAGTLLLKQALGLNSPYWDSTPLPGYCLLLGLLVPAIWGQTHTRREEQVMLAPLGFVFGIVGALTSWPVALLGLIMALTGLFAFRQFHAFFAMGLAAVALVGFVMEINPHWLVPAVIVVGLPIMISIITGRTLEVPTRDSSGGKRAKADSV